MKHREISNKICASCFGALISEKRFQLGFTQVEVADLTQVKGITANRVSELETKPRNKTLQAATVKGFATALNLTHEEIQACRVRACRQLADSQISK